MMIRSLLLGFLALLLVSVGQTSLKLGLTRIGGFSLAQGASEFMKLLSSPWIMIGFVCYGVSSILWLDVLSKLDLSLAYPMVGSTYVFTLLIGRIFFQETFGWERMLGVGLILFGLFWVVRSATSG
jgi:multidrug transporter EmrE-like cation transporter